MPLSIIAEYLKAMEARISPIVSFLKDIQYSGYIELTYSGKTERVHPALVTADVAKALAGAGLIMVATPAFTHKMIAKACAEFLEDGQIIVLNPGRTGGALEFLTTVRDLGCQKDIIVAEAQTLIYSCRKTAGNAVSIYGVKNAVDVSAFPANRIDAVLAALTPYYDQFQPVKNGLATSLANIGSMFHPLPVLLNVGRIENDERGFRYYWDGITPSVAALIEQLDAERLAVAASYGVSILSAKEWLARSYETHGDTLYERIRNNEAYGDISGPKTIQVRYMTEDVPNGLVPIAALGDAAGVETPMIDAVITLASGLYHTDFKTEGRSLQNLGIDGMSKQAILHYFETGVKL